PRALLANFPLRCADLYIDVLRAICNSMDVEVTQAEPDWIRLVGPAEKLETAREAVRKYMQHQEPPAAWCWQPSTPFSRRAPYLDVFFVSHESQEWLQVQQRVEETLSNVKIISIERLQNRWLWQQY